MYRREISLYYSNIPSECKQISLFCGKEAGNPERRRMFHSGAAGGTWHRVYKKITITALQTFKCRRIIRMKIEKRRDVQWRWTSSWQMWMTWFLTVRSRATANGKTGRTTPRGRGFFYAFLRVPKISTMRNRFSEIFRKRLRKNREIIATLTYIERKCGLIYIKKFDNSHILWMLNEK